MSNNSMAAMPLLPALMEPQVVVLSSPQGLTAPMPVITTLRILLSPRALPPP